MSAVAERPAIVPAAKEMFVEISLVGGSKIVRGFFRDELDQFFVHGDALGKPFADVPRNSKRFKICHRRTGRSLPIDRVSLSKGLAICADLEMEIEGASQIEHRGNLELVGWTPGIRAKVIDICVRHGVWRMPA